MPDYASVAAPLTDLMQKGRDWAWQSTQQHAFETLKARLLQAPVLVHPDIKKPYVLHTDASEVGIGETLSQLDTEGIPRLIACRSRKLNKAQLNYPVHEKEMLALIDALEDWRHYLLGAEIHIFTDNSALRYLQNTKQPSSRQVRWLEKLQLYSPLKIAHIPGKTNTSADALSRSPLLREEVIELGKPSTVDLSFLGNVDLSKPQQFFFQPCLMAPLASEPMPDWWPDYLNDPTIRKKYFVDDTELLKDPTCFHDNRI